MSKIWDVYTYIIDQTYKKEFIFCYFLAAVYIVVSKNVKLDIVYWAWPS